MPFQRSITSEPQGVMAALPKPQWKLLLEYRLLSLAHTD